MAKKRKRKKSVKFKIKSIMKIFFLIIFLSAVVFGVYKNENINMNNFFRKYIKVQLPMSLKIEIEKAKIVLKNIEKLIPMDNEEYKVIYVSDGDTISVKKLEKGIITGKLIKVRLFGIDAPETKQDYGYESKEALMKMIKDKNIKIKGQEKDRYGRLLGVIYYNEKNINEEMVKGGHAWWYEEYDKHNEIMKQYEKNAKNNKLGLFSKKNPIAPWEFRRNKKKLKK